MASDRTILFLGVLFCGILFSQNSGFDPKKIYFDPERRYEDLDRALEILVKNPTPENIEAMLESANLHYRVQGFDSDALATLFVWFNLLDSPPKPLPETLATQLISEIGRLLIHHPASLFQDYDIPETDRVTVLIPIGTDYSGAVVANIQRAFPYNLDVRETPSGERCLTGRDRWPCISLSSYGINRNTFLVGFAGNNGHLFGGMGIYRVVGRDVTALARDFPVSFE